MNRSFLSAAIIRAVDFYRKAISPYKGGPCCKFYPTCSKYARTAIERYGAVRGGRMAAGRILRCHPFARGGFDPVPEDPCITFKKE